MMYSNNALTTQGEEIFNTIWDNQQLRGSLFDLDNYPPNLTPNQIEQRALSEFENLVSEIDSDLYQFIKIE